MQNAREREREREWVECVKGKRLEEVLARDRRDEEERERQQRESHEKERAKKKGRLWRFWSREWRTTKREKETDEVELTTISRFVDSVASSRSGESHRTCNRFGQVEEDGNAHQ